MRAHSRRTGRKALGNDAARFRDLVDFSPDAMMVILDDRMVFANPAAARLLGAADPDILVGRSPFDFVDAADHARLRERFRAVVDDRTALPAAEYRLCRFDGSYIDVEATSGPTLWGGRAALQAILRDISVRKANEAAARESEARRVMAESALAVDASARRRSEQELRQVHQHLEMALLSSGAVTWDWDVVANRIAWNPKHRLPYGVAPEALATIEAWNRCVHPDDRGRIVERLQALLASRSEELWDEEFRILHPVLGERWIAGLGRKIADDAGHTVRVAGVNFDITARKNELAALQESEARFRAVYDNAVVGIAMTDHTGRFVRCNAAFCDLLGYREDELRQIHFAQFVHPEDREVNLREIDRLIAGEIPRYETENRYVRRDGRVIWVRKFVSLLPSVGGEPPVRLVLVSDVTERKLAQKALEESESRIRRLNVLLAQRVMRRTAQFDEEHARLQAIVDTAAEGILTIDRDGMVESINPAALRLFGYAIDDVLQHYVGVLLPSWDREASLQRFTQGDATARRRTMPATGRDREGNEIPLELSIGEIVLSGERLYAILLRDVTVQRRLEAQVRERLEDAAQLHRLRTAGELAGVLAHRLNQPLAAILSFAEAAAARVRRGKATPERIATALSEIVDQAQRAAESIRDLRSFLARERSDRAAAEIDPIVHRVLELMGVLASDARISIHHHVAKTLPPVLIHRSQIEQVLLILLDNAIDAIVEHAPEGETSRRLRGIIDIRAVPDEDGRHVLMTVRDSGPGIADQLASQVFDPLYTTKQNGIGLGLSIARSIVEDHGGRIWAEPGPGGCFRFTLPVAA